MSYGILLVCAERRGIKHSPDTYKGKFFKFLSTLYLHSTPLPGKNQYNRKVRFFCPIYENNTLKAIFTCWHFYIYSLKPLHDVIGKGTKY